MHGAPLFVLYFIFRSFHKSGFPTNKLNDNQMMFALNLAAVRYGLKFSLSHFDLSTAKLCIKLKGGGWDTMSEISAYILKYQYPKKKTDIYAEIQSQSP